MYFRVIELGGEFESFMVDLYVRNLHAAMPNRRIDE